MDYIFIDLESLVGPKEKGTVLFFYLYNANPIFMSTDVCPRPRASPCTWVWPPSVHGWPMRWSEALRKETAELEWSGQMVSRENFA